VTEEAIKAAYDARVAGLAAGIEYSAAHILVPDEQTAKDLKAQIDGGADFAELAKANSTDGSAANGGDLGWFGVGMMVKPFEDAVVAMKPGEVAGPIETQFGWHLIKLNETRDAAPPTLDALRPEITDELQRKAVDDYVAKLTAEATVTRTDGIDPALVRDQNLLGN
jgi:peptidyl-prolyl cis-trans isomerase C